MGGYCKYGENCVFRHGDRWEEIFKPQSRENVLCPKVEITLDNIQKVVRNVLEVEQ